MAFFIFLALYAKFFYQEAVVSNLSTEWPKILEDRLLYSSRSVSTAFYLADKAFIDTAVRLSKLYEAAAAPGPLNPINAGTYPTAHISQVKGIPPGG